MRPVVLAKLMEGYTTVMVAGTHGKTTTTSMIVVALQRSGFDPSFAVGGDLGQPGTNAHHGSGTTFVAEADESDGSLLEYTPDVAVVTNVEADHLDFFGSVEAYVAVFDEFVARVRPGGALVVCMDDEGAAALAARWADRGVRVLRYGSGDDATLAGALLDWEQQGTGGVATIRLSSASHPHGLRLAVPGRHMALNALAAAVAAVEVGADVDAVLDGLAGFEGARRRFEAVGAAAGVRVFDDYAHHPTEVRVNLAALRAVAGDARSIVVFQPHLYSRTQTFAREFGQALERCRPRVRTRRLRRARATDRGHQRGQCRRARRRARAIRAGLLRGRRQGRRRGSSGRRRRDHGCRRRHPAGPGDPLGTAVEGVAVTEPTDTDETPEPVPGEVPARAGR